MCAYGDLITRKPQMEKKTVSRKNEWAAGDPAAKVNSRKSHTVGLVSKSMNCESLPTSSLLRSLFDGHAALDASSRARYYSDPSSSHSESYFSKGCTSQRHAAFRPVQSTDSLLNQDATQTKHRRRCINCSLRFSWSIYDDYCSLDCHTSSILKRGGYIPECCPVSDESDRFDSQEIIKLQQEVQSAEAVDIHLLTAI